MVSGGHTQFLSVEGLSKYKRLGTTIDDAVGEAFDKTAKLLGIEFPGGPQIEKYAIKGNFKKYKLPKPIINKGGCNLSFAGLKTAVLKIAQQIKTNQEKYDLAASFQKTIEEILYKKSKIAFKEFKRINGNKNNTFVVAGGVASNKKIREVLTNLCKEENFKHIFPPISLRVSKIFQYILFYFFYHLFRKDLRLYKDLFHFLLNFHLSLLVMVWKYLSQDYLELRIYLQN